MLLRAGGRIEDRRQDEEEDRGEQHDERQNGGIGDAANLPALAPASERCGERPTKERESEDDHGDEEERAAVDVVEDVVPDLVPHDSLDLLRRTTAEQVVVHGDAHRLPEPAHVRAHARRLARRIHLVDVVRLDSVHVREPQHRLGDFRVVQRRHFVEEREDEDWSGHGDEDQEQRHHSRAPDPPGALEFADDREKDRDENAAEDRIDEKAFELVAHPRSECLRRHAVLMLAVVPLVPGEREGEDGRDDEVFDPVDDRVDRAHLREPLGEVAHPRRPAEVQQDDRDDDAVQEVPQDQPIGALEVRVRPRPRRRRDLREIPLGRRIRIKVRRRLRRRRNGNDRRHLRVRERVGTFRKHGDTDEQREDDPYVLHMEGVYGCGGKRFLPVLGPRSSVLRSEPASIPVTHPRTEDRGPRTD